MTKKPPSTATERRQQLLKEGSGWLLWCAAILGLLAMGSGQAAQLSAAGAAVGLAFVLRDVAQLQRGKLGPITLFAFALFVSSLANAVGFLSISYNGLTSPYAIYADEDFFFLASALLSIGGIATIVGYRYVSAFGVLEVLTSPLPMIHTRVRSRFMITGGVAISALGMAVDFLPPERIPGTLGSLLMWGPNLVVFALARVGFSSRHTRTIAVALVIALLEATRAALFDYLRFHIVLPIFAFTLAAIIGTRSLRILRTWSFAPIYLVATIFIAYFAILGQARGSRSTGMERIADVASNKRELELSGTSDAGLMVRLTTLNQLSQIGRLVQERGYLHGQTLQYLAFAFVPRMLWPEKPVIAKGQWFAFQIGQAFEDPEGGYTNSVNMTVPGELYLNFGWVGVVIGCFAFGSLLAVLWSRTAFWSDPRNVLGSAFGFYVLWSSFGAGADIQIVVTLIAMYLLFVVASFSAAALG